MNWNWEDRTDDRSGLQWRWRETGNHVFIYIPGTDHKDDWNHHKKIGLFEAADGIWVTRADLMLAYDIVKTIGDTNKAIRVGGHSWGGGITALLVWIWMQRGKTVHGWLFGPKQVGNRAFVSETAKNITAIVTGET